MLTNLIMITFHNMYIHQIIICTLNLHNVICQFLNKSGAQGKKDGKKVLIEVPSVHFKCSDKEIPKQRPERSEGLSHADI